jgi:hypothetical protein
MQIEAIARICHEANRAYCESIGDNSQVPWEMAPLWQKRSAIDGVAFLLAHPDASPRASHDNWMREKAQEGWTYGPVKDPMKKEHPCMVAYMDLPPEHRVKDYLFMAIVRVLA